MEIQVKTDEIWDVHHSLVTLTASPTEVEASFGHQGLSYRRTLILVTSVKPAIKLFDPFDILNKEGGRIVVSNFFPVGIVADCHCLSVLRTLQHFINLEKQSTFDQMHVSNIDTEDEV